MSVRTISDSGGTRNWNDTASWVEGVVPAAQDDIGATSTSGNLIVNSSQTEQLRSFDLTNYIGTLSGSGTILVRPTSTGTWNCIFSTGMTQSWTGILSVNPSGATTNVNLYTNGKSIVNVDKMDTGNLIFKDNTNITGTLTNTQGTLKTDGASDNSGLAHSWGVFSSSGTTARTLNLGLSTITITSANTFPWYSTGTNLTWVATDFTLIIATTHASNFPYIDGVFPAGCNSTLTLSNTMAGAFFRLSGTIGTLNITGKAAQTVGIQIQNGFTITNALNINGNSAINRLLIQSSVIGTARAITCNGTISASNVDFQNITGAGSASWDLSAITGGSGDTGGNSGITFTPATTQTWNGTTGYWSNVALWTSRIPLPQDNVIIGAATVNGNLLTVNMPRIGKNITVNNTGASTKPNLGLNNMDVTLYGNLTFVSSTYMTLSLSKIITFGGRSNCSITSAGHTFISYVVINISTGNTCTLNDAFICNGQFQILNGSTFDCNEYNVTAKNVIVGYSATVYRRSATWILTDGNYAWRADSGSNSTGVNDTIYLTYALSTTTTFQGGTATYNNIVITPGTGKLVFTGAFTFANIRMASAGSRTINFTSGTVYTMTGTDFFTGNSTAPTLDTPRIDLTTLNGGFETLGAGGLDIFGTWAEARVGTGIIVADTTNPHSGTYSCKIIADGYNNRAGVYQQTLTVGSVYKISLWIKSESGTPVVSIMDSVGVIYKTFTVDTTYREYICYFPCTYDIFISVRTTAGTGVYVDDITVSKLLSSVNVVATTIGTPFIINKTSGTISTDNIYLQDCTVSGGLTAAYCGSHSIDGGGNSGWLFLDPVTGGNGWIFILNRQIMDSSPFKNQII